MNTPRILIIAGSDSGGGAGIQADIKTVTMLGGHAMTAITALTAQNTLGVQGVMPVPAEFVVQQIESCVSDIGVDAVKIGMIGSAETAHAVADVLERLDVPIVFDPVMIATSGSVLADAATIAAFERLMRAATLTTPNIPELRALGGAAKVLEYGCALLAKGGHGPGDVLIDRLVADELDLRLASERIDTRHTHGTGCTLASAITTNLGRGAVLDDAVDAARQFVRLALHGALGFGGGHGPMGHQTVRLDGLTQTPTPNQITLPLADFSASAVFYEALGLRRIVDAAPRYARFESEAGVTVSIEAADEMPHGPMLYFECHSLDAAVADLRKLGATVSDPIDQSWGWREARTRDPAGNAICLYQAGETRRYPPWRLPDA